jgi:MYXO-CTERM domain-containing protein
VHRAVDPLPTRAQAQQARRRSLAALALAVSSLFASNVGAAGTGNGSTCALGSDCTSGFCSEGVCCNTACVGTCVSCLAKNKGGSNGTSGNVRATLDPYDQCAQDSLNTCGTTGLCDGKGACAVAGVGSSCTFTSCASANSAVSNGVCDGKSACVPNGIITCQLGYLCVDGNCKSGCSQDSDCDAAAGFICTKAGMCLKPKGSSCHSDANCTTGACQYGFCCLPNQDGACAKPLGVACGAAGECASGQCSDGVCCASSCVGPCLSCALAAHPGTCSLLTDGLCAAPADAGTDASSEADGGTDGGNTAHGGQPNGGFAAGGFAAGGFAAGAPGSYGGQAGSSSNGDGSSGLAAFAGAGHDAAAGNTIGGASPTGNMGQATGVEQCATGAQCENGLACDPATHVCAEQLVTACGCRVAGERAGSGASWALFSLFMAAAVRRRKRPATRSARAGSS